MNLHHIAIAVRDIEKAMTWFAEMLGFDKLLPPGITEMVLFGYQGFRCIIANDNGVQLELEQRTDRSFPKDTDAIISHFSLEVEDLEALEQHLRDKGALTTTDKIIELGKIKILYFNGIDGVRIELIQSHA